MAGAIIFIFIYALILYRLFLLAMPLKEGEIEENSRDEFVYHVYLLFYLIFFNSIIRSGFFPVPLMRLVYIALGARLGPNTYSAGYANAPNFIEVSANALVLKGTRIGPGEVWGGVPARLLRRGTVRKGPVVET